MQHMDFKAKTNSNTNGGVAVHWVHLAVREDADRAALRLNLTAEPLDGGQQVHRALDGLRDAPAATRLRQTRRGGARPEGGHRAGRTYVNDNVNVYRNAVQS